MAKRIEIIKAEEKDNAYTVTYATGTTKVYPVDKLPKTVQAWLEEHPVQEPEQEPEKIDLDDDSQTMYLDLYAEGATWHPVEAVVEEVVEGVVETVDGAVEEPVRKQYASSTQADLPAVAQKPELTVPDNSMGAAEAVAFGTCIAMAIAFWGIVGMIQIFMSGIEVLRTLARPRVARLAKEVVRNLPTVTTKRGLAVAVRVLPVLVGIMAII